MISRVQLRVGAAPGGSPARRVAVLGPCCGLLLLLAGPGLAEARERVAALVLGAEEASEPLADQCTEVLVAAVSRQTDQEIVGKEEFLARLGLPDRAGVETCLVLTGVTSAQEAETLSGDLKPDYVVEDLGGLLELDCMKKGAAAAPENEAKLAD